MSSAPALILGIETSCDETAAALVTRYPDGTGQVHANIVRTQLAEHRAFGGVVPEIAARSHVQWIDHIVRQAFDEANLDMSAPDGIAATAGPGLIGGLLVGLTTAKAIAKATGKPFLAINHLEGHVLTARLTDNVPYPFLVLLVSGGHSQFVLVKGVGQYERWGTTIDDALGEAFDKVAKMLDLGFPGGPVVEAWAKKGDPERFGFPKPLIKEQRLDFSFSGLKTAVRLAAEKIAPLDDQDAADICASFQATIVAILQKRCAQAIRRFAAELPGTRIRLVVAGGVAANAMIAGALRKTAQEHETELVVPPLHLCTDNGAMIAWAGAERLVLGQRDPTRFAPLPRWPLESENMTTGASGA